MSKKIGLTLFAVAVIGLLSLPTMGGRKNRPNNVLHELAKKKGGHLVVKHRPNRSTLYPNLDALAKHSDIIVVGRALGHRPSMRPDGNFITEDFLFRIQEVIKGDVKAGTSILITLPGGSYRYPDGTYVTTQAVDYRPTEDGRTYVFFLRNKGAFYKGHTPAAEAQGQFELAEGKVQPADTVATDPVVTKYKGVAAPAFLSELHRAVPVKKKQ